MEKEFELIKIKFEAAENAAEMALKRSYKDKKEYFELYNNIEQIVEANKERSKKNVEFVKQISERVNSLIEVEKIDVSLYSQDEMDKNLTKLYGFDNAAGKKPDLFAP